MKAMRTNFNKFYFSVRKLRFRQFIKNYLRVDFQGFRASFSKSLSDKTRLGNIFGSGLTEVNEHCYSITQIKV